MIFLKNLLIANNPAPNSVIVEGSGTGVTGGVTGGTIGGISGPTIIGGSTGGVNGFPGV